MKEEIFDELKPRMTKRYRAIHEQITDVIQACGVEEYVEINTVLLGQSIIDYFLDIEALKIKEGIKRVNESKIYAYQTYWFLRRQPVQIVGNRPHDTREIFINEIIAVALIIPKVFKEAGARLDYQCKEIKRFTDLLFYNFKYRHYTQQSLELMVEGMLSGFMYESKKKE
ncbi:MAG: hypothetical protein K5639_01680 [Eubacterium sp.]|nr:hypothetical protein [Eubacterium sp.]